MSVTNGGNRAAAVRVAGINAGDHLKFIPILNIVSGCGNCGALSPYHPGSMCTRARTQLAVSKL
jgi:hypothetical protein